MPGSSEILGYKYWDKQESWLPVSSLSSVQAGIQKLSEIVCHQHLVERTSSHCCPGVMDGLSQLVKTYPAQHGFFKWFGLAWRSTVLKVKWNILFFVSLAKNWLWLPSSLCVPCSRVWFAWPAEDWHALHHFPGSDSMKNTHPQGSVQTLAGKWRQRSSSVHFDCFRDSLGVAKSILSACQDFTQGPLIIASVWFLAFCRLLGQRRARLPSALLLPDLGYCWATGTCSDVSLGQRGIKRQVCRSKSLSCIPKTNRNGTFPSECSKFVWIIKW